MIRRFGGALVHELKRALCTRGIREFSFPGFEPGFCFDARVALNIFEPWNSGPKAAAMAAALFFLEPDDLVWDIGASVGLFSVHSTSRHCEGCRRLRAGSCHVQAIASERPN